MGDQDRVKILRRELEGWREILVGLHSVLVWDKQFYPAISFSVLSFVFLLVWYIDPAVLTLLSFVGIIITFSDYLVPQITPYIWGSNNWTGAQERKYEQIVNNLAGTFNMIGCFTSKIKNIKATKPKLYFASVITSLLIFAYIGSSVNNMFLTYLIVMFGVMFPGLRKQDIIRKNFGMMMSKLSKYLKSSSDETKETSKAKDTTKDSKDTKKD